MGPKILPLSPLAIPSLFYVKNHSFNPASQALHHQFDFKKFIYQLDPIEGAKVKSLSLLEIFPLRTWMQEDLMHLILICPNLERIELHPRESSDAMLLALAEHKNLKEIFCQLDVYNNRHIALFSSQQNDSPPTLTDEALRTYQSRFSYVNSDMIGDNWDLTQLPQLRYLHINKAFKGNLTIQELVKQLKTCPQFVSLLVENKELVEEIYKSIKDYLNAPSPEHEGLFLLQHLPFFSQGYFEEEEKELFLKALEHLPSSCALNLIGNWTSEEALKIAVNFKERKYTGWCMHIGTTPAILLSRRIPEDISVDDEAAALLLQSQSSYDYPKAIDCLREWVSATEFSPEKPLPPRVQFALSQLKSVTIDKNFFPDSKREAFMALLKKAPHLKSMGIQIDVSNDPLFISQWDGFSFDTISTTTNFLSLSSWEEVSQKWKPRHLNLEHPEGTHNFVAIYTLLSKNYFGKLWYWKKECFQIAQESDGFTMELVRRDNS